MTEKLLTGTLRSKTEKKTLLSNASNTYFASQDLFFCISVIATHYCSCKSKLPYLMFRLIISRALRTGYYATVINLMRLQKTFIPDSPIRNKIQYCSCQIVVTFYDSHTAIFPEASFFLSFLILKPSVILISSAKYIRDLEINS